MISHSWESGNRGLRLRGEEGGVEPPHSKATGECEVLCNARPGRRLRGRKRRSQEAAGEGVAGLRERRAGDCKANFGLLSSSTAREAARVASHREVALADREQGAAVMSPGKGRNWPGQDLRVYDARGEVDVDEPCLEVVRPRCCGCNGLGLRRQWRGGPARCSMSGPGMSVPVRGSADGDGADRPLPRHLGRIRHLRGKRLARHVARGGLRSRRAVGRVRGGHR